MFNHKTVVSPTMLLISVMAVMVLVTGCNQQSVSRVDGSTPTALAVPTQTPLPTPQDTPTPAAIPATPTPTPNLTATAAACRPAAQVTDVTVPDGSQFKPGEAFVKTWRFASSGNCAWKKDTILAFQSGERFGAPDALPLDAVDIGKSVEISLTMKAPQRAGAYMGHWVLQQPSGQIIAATSLRINVFAPTPKPAVAPAPTAKPAASALTGHIPPVGSGPFNADESASGPWNCVGLLDDRGARQWVGDFYIGVRGGPGNYTISDPDNCHWDVGEQKFVCRYSGGINAQVMRTLYASCPGCTPRPVALSGRGVETRDQGSGICRVQSFVAPTPTAGGPGAPPGQPVAPLYPKTPIQPWSRDAFIKAVGASKNSAGAFLAYFTELVKGKQGNCWDYWGKFYSQWEIQPGFTNVPDRWYPQYYKYRTILESARTTAAPITQVCLKGGGHVEEEADKIILASFESIVNRLGELYSEVQAMK